MAETLNPMASNSSQEVLNPMGKNGPDINPMEIDSSVSRTFESIIKDFRESEDPLFNQYADILRQLQGTLEEKNISEVSTILHLFSADKNPDELLGYLKRLQEIEKNFNVENNTLTQETRVAEGEVRNDINEVGTLENVRQIFWGSTSLRKIQAIEIDGSISTPEEFLKKIGKVIDTTKNLPEFKNLSPTGQNLIIQSLQNMSDTVEEGEQKQLDFLDEQFDNFASQIEADRDGGSVTIYMGEGSVEFESKEKAFEFAYSLKQSAEDEFASAWPNLLELTGDSISYILLTGFGTKTVLQNTWKAAEYLNHNSLYSIETEEEDSPFGGESIFNNVFGIITYGLSIAATVNYAETIYTRVILDTLAKVGVRQTKIKIPKTDRKITILPFAGDRARTLEGSETVEMRLLRIPDFNLDDVFVAESGDAQLRNEYIQRVRAIEKIENTIKTLPPEQIPAAERELRKVKSYLNVNTRTFWLKAWSLDRNHGLGLRIFNGITGGPSIFGRNLRDNATQHFNLDNTSRNELKKSLEFLFEGSYEIQQDEKTKVISIKPADGSTFQESQDIQNIQNYILSRTDLSQSEKQRRLTQIDRLIENIRNNPVGLDTVKRALYNVAENGYLSQEDIKIRIETYIEERFPHLGRKPADRTWSEWWLEQRRGMRNAWGAIAPSTLTAQDSMIFRFSQIVDNGGWTGSSEDLDKIFDKIDSGKLELTQIYSGRKTHFVGDFFLGFFNRYGINSPELSQLRRFSEEVSNTDFDTILKAGENAGKQLKAIQDIINKGIEINGEIRTPIQAVRNYISYALPDALEEKINTRLNNYFKDIESGKILTTELEFFREVEKIINGFLPTHSILLELEKIQKNDTVSDDVKSYITDNLEPLVREGRVNITADEIKKLGGGDIHVGIIERIPYDAANKDNFISEITNFEKYHENDFQERLSGLSYDTSFNANNFETAILETYKNDLINLKVVFYVEGRNFEIDKNLKIFSRELTNRYTEGQAKIVLDRIFSGEDFSSIRPDLESITSDKTIVANDGFTIDSKSMLKDTYINFSDPTSANFDENKTKDMLDFIQDENIDRASLPQVIQQALTELEGSGEASEAISRQKSQIESYTAQLNDAEDIDEMRTIRDQFNAYISNPANKINPTDPEFSDLINEFNERFKHKRAELRNTNPGVDTSTPREESSTRPTETAPRTGSEFLGRNTNLGRGYEAFKMELLMNPDININPDTYFTNILSREFSSRAELFTAMNQKLLDDININNSIQIRSVSAIDLGKLEAEYNIYQKAMAEDIYRRHTLSSDNEINDRVIGAIRNSIDPFETIKNIDISQVPEWDKIDNLTLTPDQIETLRSIQRGGWRNDDAITWRNFLDAVKKAST